MFFPVRPVLCAVCAVCLCLPAAAQKFLPKSIQFKGDPEFSESEFLAAAGLKSGVTLGYEEMSARSQKLMDTGLFETVNFKFDGQNLIYSLAPSSALFPIRLDNLPLKPGKELDEQIRARVPLYHGKVPAEGTVLDDVRSALEEVLAADGMKVNIAVMPAANLGSTKPSAMAFSIATPAIRIGAIKLSGVSPELQAKVQSVADHETGAPFLTLDAAPSVEHALELFYREEGYAAVEIHAVRASNPVVGADAIDIPFSASIREGRLYKFGKVSLPADALISQEKVDQIAKAGALAEDRTLRSVLLAISTAYKSKGYIDCKVSSKPRLDEATGTVSYAIGIESGPLYHLGFMKFENVSDEVRLHLMKYWHMLPGDPLDETYITHFVEEAQQGDPQLRRLLQVVKIDYKISGDPQTKQANLTIRLEMPH